MIQTTLLDYFTCNNNKSHKHKEYKLQLFKQTSLQDYFKIEPKKKTITSYFKPKEEKVEEREKSKE